MYAYKEIYYNLKNNIFSGVYSYGQRIPTEKALMSYYNVSRMTVQKAIALLVKDGWVTRFPGKGSFVDYQSPISSNEKKLCVILSKSSNHGLDDIIKGIRAFTEVNNYELSIIFLDKNNSSQNTFKRIFEANYAGYIIQNNIEITSIKYLTEMYLKRIPIVLLDNKMQNLSFASVSSDNIAGGYAAMDYALNQGHEHIGFLTSKKSLTYTSVRDRFLGFEQRRLEAEQNQSEMLILDNNHHESLKNCLLSWKRQGGTCLICENDLIAIELIEVAYQINLSVPEDVSIIGFDNLKLSKKIQPALTTLSQNFYQLGYTAGKEVHSLFRPFGKNTDNFRDIQHNVIPMVLVERDSVLALNKKN